MEQKIKEEKIENNLVFCIDRRKNICNQIDIKIDVFRNPSHKSETHLLSISVF